METTSNNDCLSKEDFAELEESQAKILDGLYKQVRDSEEARAWLNTNLGRRFMKFVAADKMRSMKLSAIGETEEDREKARFDYAVVCKLETVFGSIIIDGVEALKQLEIIDNGDTHEE